MEIKTKIAIERKYIQNIPIKKRVLVRQKLNAMKENIKRQDALLKELYLLPNKIYQEKIDLFLKGRICWEELEHTATATMERYAKILNIGKNKNGI